MARGLKKGVENSTQGVESSSTDSPIITKNQREILYLLTKEYETPKNIALRRQISLTAVYKTIKKLRQKGYLTHSFTRGLKKMGRTMDFQPPQKLQKGIRLHNQQFRIKILFKSDYYKQIRAEKSMMIFESHTVLLHKDALLLSCNELKHFYGETADRAMALSMQYWNKIFFKLQDRLKVIVIKGENTNIRQFNAHFAEIGNELAKQVNEAGEKIKIYAREDGKLWFMIDNSFNLHEAETLKPDTAQRDMQEAIQPFFNDLRDNSPPTLSEIMRLHKLTCDNLHIISQIMRAHNNQLGEGQGDKKLNDYFG